MLWSFASVMPLEPSLVAAPVVVRQPATRPAARYYPSGTNPATYSPIVCMRGVPSPICSRPPNGARGLATWIRPPPLPPEKKVIPHFRSVSISAKFPLVCSSATPVSLVRRLVAVLTDLLLVACLVMKPIGGWTRAPSALHRFGSEACWQRSPPLSATR